MVVSTPASALRHDATHPRLPHAAGMQHEVSVPQNAYFSQLRRVALTNLRCCWVFFFVTDCDFDFLCCSGIFSEAALAADFSRLPTPSHGARIYLVVWRVAVLSGLSRSHKNSRPFLSFFFFLLCLENRNAW